MSQVVLATSGSAPQQHPVRSSITGAAKALGIDEGFSEPDRVSVHPLPVAREHCRHAAENMRGQVWHLDPGQNQKARVICNETDVAFARLLAPTDVTIAASEMTRGGTPRHAGDGPPLRPYQVLQMLA